MDKQLIIAFNFEELQVLDLALAELPYRLAAPLINRINAELQKQNTEQNE